MKKSVSVFLCLSMVLTVLFCTSPTVAKAETLKQETETLNILSKNEISSFVDYESALQYGHVERAYAEEELNTIVYCNQDGSKTAYIFDYDVQYVTSDGTLAEKNITLKQENGAFTVSESNVRLEFPEDITAGIVFTHQDRSINLVPLRNTILEESFDKGLSLRNQPLDAVMDSTKNAVSYERAFGYNTSLVYTPLMNGVKEDIVLHTYNGINTWRFLVNTDGLYPYVDEYGGYYFAESENAYHKYYLGSVYVYDTAGDITNGSIEIATVRDGNQYILTINVDSNFLANAEYPVTVDPTLTLTEGGISDATIFDEKPTLNTGSAQFMYIGENNLHGMGRGLLRFDSLLNNNLFLYYMDNITSSTLHLYASAVPSGGETIQFHQFTNPAWNEGTVTWSNINPNGFSSTVLASKNITQVGNFTVDLPVSLLSSWKANANNLNGGLLIKVDNENQSTDYVGLASSEYSIYGPMLVIRYEADVTTHFNSNLSLVVGETRLIPKTYIYEDYTQYYSRNTEVATVSPTGVVTGVSEGTALIEITVRFDVNGDGDVTDAVDEKFDCVNSVIVKNDPNASTLQGHQYAGSIGIAWVRDLEKSPLTDAEMKNQTYIIEVDFLTDNTLQFLTSLKAEESSILSWLESIPGALTTDMVIAFLVRRGIISDKWIVSSLVGIVVDLIVKYRSDYLTDLSYSHLQACATLVEPGDFAKITHSYQHGEHNVHYEIYYTSELYSIENPVPGVYGYWYLDTFSKLFPIK